MPMLNVGDAAPEFSLPNQSGATTTLSQLQGKNVLIWFFPRAYGGG